MKKSLLPDFRRETVRLIEKHNISVNTIVKELGVHFNTAYAWKNGKKSPTQRNFKDLKRLATSTLLSKSPIDSHKSKAIKSDSHQRESNPDPILEGEDDVTAELQRAIIGIQNDLRDIRGEMREMRDQIQILMESKKDAGAEERMG